MTTANPETLLATELAFAAQIFLRKTDFFAADFLMRLERRRHGPPSTTYCTLG